MPVIKDENPDLDLATNLTSNDQPSNIKTFIVRVVGLLNKAYKDKLDQLLDIWIDPGFVISGIFRDGQKYMEFTIGENDLEFKQVDKPTKKLDSFVSYSPRYDAPIKKRCKKGVICKGSCIEKGKVCRNELTAISSPLELSQLRRSVVDFQLATQEKLSSKNPIVPVESEPAPSTNDYRINPETNQEYTIRELKTEASKEGIYQYSRLSKEELRQAIVASKSNPTESTRQRLALTFGKDRSTGSSAIRASGLTGRQKRQAQDVNKTWKNLNTLAKFASTQPVGWGAAATGAFLLGVGVRRYELMKSEYRASFKGNAEQAQEKAATLGSVNNGKLSRTGNKKNITFVIGADRGEEGSQKIIDKLKSFGDSAKPGEADEFFQEKAHHYVPFGLKESGAKVGASATENGVNALTDYLNNFRRKKDQDAVDLAAQIYAYGIQRKVSTKRQTQLTNLESRHQTLIKTQPTVEAKIEKHQQDIDKFKTEIADLEANLLNASNANKNKIQAAIAKKKIAVKLQESKSFSEQGNLDALRKETLSNRAQLRQVLSRPETGTRDLANKGKNINIIAHSRAGQTSKTALEYLARMQLPGEPSGKDVLEQVNLVMLGTPHFGFTENIGKRQRTIVSQQDPLSNLPIWGNSVDNAARTEWVSSVKGHYIDDYLNDSRTREIMREQFGYYDDSLLERNRKLAKKDAIDYLEARFDKAQAKCKTGKPCKTESGKVVCIPKKNKCASDATPIAAVGKLASENKLLTGLAIAGVSGAVVASSLAGAAALISHDLKKSEIPFDSIPPVPEGDPESWTEVKEQYNQLKPGDLIRKNIKGGVLGNRQHYAVYIGKDPTVDPNSIYSHLLIDTGVNWKSKDKEPYVRVHGLAWFGVDMNSKDNSLYEKVPEKDMGLTKGTQKFTGEEVVERANKMLYQKFTYKGFDSNCEAFARAIVEGKGYSIQGQKNSSLTNFTAGLVTDKALSLRFGDNLQEQKSALEKLERSGKQDTPEYAKAKEILEGAVNERKVFGEDGKAIKIAGKEVTGLSSYAKDKYKMNAQQIADYLDREKAFAERRNWEQVANPYSGQLEEGYLGKMAKHQERQTKARYEQEFAKKRAAEKYKPFNSIVSLFKKPRKDADIPDSFYENLGLPSPEAFSRQIETIANKYPKLANNIKIDGVKNYLLLLYGLLNRDINSASYHQAKSDALSFRFDKKADCNKGKPCKTKDGNIVCIPKENKCGAEESNKKSLITGGIALASGAGISAGVIAASLAAREIIEGTKTEDISRKQLSVLSQDATNKIKVTKAVDSQGATSKTYFAENEKGEKFVFKQSEPQHYYQAASEVVASDMAAKSGIKANRTQLIPTDVSHPKKDKERAVTLHSLVPGKEFSEVASESGFKDVAISQKGGVDRNIVKAIAQHQDLAKIAALDTFTGNWDRNGGNFFYDKKSDQFTAIDLGVSYSRVSLNNPSIPNQTRENISKMDFSKLSDKEVQGLKTYSSTLKDLYVKNPPDEIVKQHAKYLKLSGGNWDMFRRHISVKQIFDDHKNSGRLVAELERKLAKHEERRDSSYQQAYQQALNYRLDKACGNSFIPDNAICRVNQAKASKKLTRPKQNKNNSELNNALAAGASLALVGAAGAVGGGMIANAANKNERSQADLDRRTATIEKAMAEQKNREAEQKLAEANDKLAQTEKNYEEINKTSLKKSLGKVIKSAALAAIPAAIASTPGGFAGAVIAGASAAGIAGVKSALSESKTLLEKSRNKNLQAAGEVLGATTPLLESKAERIAQSVKDKIQEKESEAARKILQAEQTKQAEIERIATIERKKQEKKGRLRNAAKQVALSAASAAVPGAISGSVAGPQGALLSGATAGAIAGAKSAIEETKKLIGSEDNLKNVVAQSTLSSVSSLADEKAQEIEGKIQEKIEKEKLKRNQSRSLVLT